MRGRGTGEQGPGELKRIHDPIELGSVKVRNRIFLPAHSTNFGAGPGGGPSDAHFAYYTERAEGGVGLIITEAVRTYAPTTSGRKVKSVSDECIDGFAALAQDVHDAGARIFAQLNEPGRHAGGVRRSDRVVALSSSTVPWSPAGPVPHQLTRAEISDFVKSLGEGASRLARAGFDGIELHIGHGHLLQQFLSPTSNLRTDPYGGSLQGRMKIVRECLAAVVATAPGTVGIRVSADEFLEGGLEPAQMLEISGLLIDEFPLNFVHVTQSAYVETYSLSTQVPDMASPGAPYRHYTRMFKEAFPAVPILGVCKIDTLQMAESLLAAGDADMVGMARAQIADGRLVAKSLGGRPDSVRHCVGCNQACLGRLEVGLPISCMVNPRVGLERQFAAVPGREAVTPSRLLVVGAGPAGLESAVTAARRGHEVTVLEKADQIGGSLRCASKLDGRGQLQLLISDLERDAREEGVSIVTGHDVTFDEITRGPWDAVVIATGSSPVVESLAGHGAMLTAEQIVAGDRALGSHVLLWDMRGDWESGAVAEHLARSRARVSLVTPRSELFGGITVYSRLGLMARLRELGVVVRTLGEPISMSAGGRVRVRDTFSGAEFVIDEVSDVVQIGPRRSNSHLASQVDALGCAIPVYVIGDCYAPRSAVEAVYEGRLTGLAVGLGDIAALAAFEGFRGPAWPSTSARRAADSSPAPTHSIPGGR